MGSWGLGSMVRGFWGNSTCGVVEDSGPVVLVLGDHCVRSNLARTSSSTVVDFDRGGGNRRRVSSWGDHGGVMAGYPALCSW